MLWLRKRQNEKLKQTSGDNAGYGVRSRSSPEEMEKAQTLPNFDKHPTAVDAVYFNGGNELGYYFVAATARRQNNIVQTILYLRTPDLGLLEKTTMPDTRLSGTGKEEFAAEGLRLEPVEPMKKWRLLFKGKMRICRTKEEVDVDFDLIWTAFTNYFDFDTDMNPETMADAICRQKWSREYFDTLKSAHQTHYEQFGEITGIVKISGHNDVTIKVQGVRDHSYGNHRDWKDLHRYGIQYCTLDDKTAICVGAISMPITLSRLHMGYVLCNGKVESVSYTDFELHNHGEDGKPPRELVINFKAGGKSYNMKCKVEDMGVFYIGEGRDAKIYERFCRYEVNGVPGWGISEWDYRYNLYC
ncbi:hypothetical protein FSP39_001292 [Pinctada imbricata]|uniref:DUF7064 domain-containing protein n=1 Tax=Pinctada imbricata TaxID=66713 RepID=A0AA88XWH0_PINIB|nr:hypothetical protein FSP39_001292 [Pinctada imbricata]